MIEVRIRCCCGGNVAHLADQEAANEAEDDDGEKSRDAERRRIERRARVVGRALLLIVGEHHVRRLGVGGKRIRIAVLAQSGEERLSQRIHAPAVGDARTHVAAAGDMPVAILRRNEKDDRTVFCRGCEAVIDLVCRQRRTFAVEILQRIDGDTCPVRRTELLERCVQ